MMTKGKYKDEAYLRLKIEELAQDIAAKQAKKQNLEYKLTKLYLKKEGKPAIDIAAKDKDVRSNDHSSKDNESRPSALNSQYSGKTEPTSAPVLVTPRDLENIDLRIKEQQAAQMPSKSFAQVAVTPAKRPDPGLSLRPNTLSKKYYVIFQGPNAGVYAQWASVA